MWLPRQTGDEMHIYLIKRHLLSTNWQANAKLIVGRIKYLITFSVGRFLTKQLLNALRILKFYVFKKAVGTVVSKGILFSS